LAIVDESADKDNVDAPIRLNPIVDHVLEDCQDSRKLSAPNASLDEIRIDVNVGPEVVPLRDASNNFESFLDLASSIQQPHYN